ncbi:hypothetical protein L0Y49_00155, partial [bacterium]|nr:hypothetical protein [bacterium]MCI0565585.1 hypothetical protein [bacterium]
LKISTIFFAFLAAFSPRTMNSRYVNSFFTSSKKGGFFDTKNLRALSQTEIFCENGGLAT